MKKDLILHKEYLDFPEKGINFIDLTQSLLDPKVTDEIINSLIKLCKKDIKNIDYIISPDARGFIWGSMIAKKLNLGFIPVRKVGKLPDEALLGKIKYKTEYSVTELCLPKADINNKKLLFVDDVYATGGTYFAIKELINQNGGTLIGGVVLVDINISKNKDLKSLAKARDLINKV